MKTNTCLSCGKIFQSPKVKKYCSPQCNKDRNEKYTHVPCMYCGKDMRVKKIEYQKLLDGKKKSFTCSIECSAKYRTKERLPFTCDNCGQTYYRKESEVRCKHKFCSKKCEYDYKYKLTHSERICELCGKPFVVANARKDRFCSINCSNTRIGAKNGRWNSKEVSCTYCGKPIYVPQYKIKLTTNHFCNTECRQKWYAEFYSQQEEVKEYNRQNIIKMLNEGRMSLVNSKPQIAINNLLSKLKIEYENEYKTKYYAIDNYLTKYNLMIEVMGDYWHSNPLRFNKTNMNGTQRVNAGRDKAKHSYISKHYDIEILYLWESDIKNNLLLCEKLIQSYIANKGKLANYHSYNYILDENQELKLKDEIIQIA